MAAPVTEAAIAQIRELITTGELGPGAKLPSEPELAAKLGLSRNTAREAVRALASARVLDVRRGDGTYVTSLRPELLLEGVRFAVDLMRDDSYLELVSVRRILEPAATALAATHVTSAELADIGLVLDRMRASAGDLEQLVAHDAEFHDRVASASGNHTLASMLAGLSSRTLRARVWRGMLDDEVAPRTVAEHERIYAALVAGDERLAEAAALVHVSTTEAWLRRVLGEQSSSSGVPRAPRSIDRTSDDS